MTLTHRPAPFAGLHCDRHVLISIIDFHTLDRLLTTRRWQADFVIHRTTAIRLMSATDTSILLRPRPYAKCSGTLLLLPLLPRRKSLKPLPSEIWTEILAFAILLYGTGNESSLMRKWGWSLTTVCKAFSVYEFIFYHHLLC